LESDHIDRGGSLSRSISALKEERVAAAKTKGPPPSNLWRTQIVFDRNSDIPTDCLRSNLASMMLGLGPFSFFAAATRSSFNAEIERE